MKEQKKKPKNRQIHTHIWSTIKQFNGESIVFKIKIVVEHLDIIIKEINLTLTCVPQMFGCHPTKQRSQIRCPVRAHTWAVCSIPA